MEGTAARRKEEVEPIALHAARARDDAVLFSYVPAPKLAGNGCLNKLHVHTH